MADLLFGNLGSMRFQEEKKDSSGYVTTFV